MFEYIKFFQVTILIEILCYELEKYVNVILNIYGFLLNIPLSNPSRKQEKTKLSSFF